MAAVCHAMPDAELPGSRRMPTRFADLGLIDLGVDAALAQPPLRYGAM